MNSSKASVNRFFEDQIKENATLLEKTKRAIRRTAFLRVAVFSLTVIGIYFATARGMEWVIGIGFAGFGIFIALAVRHARLFKKKAWYQTLLGINRDELKLLAGITEGRDEGREFLDESHPFTFNLDIFGKGSLFQFIDRSATRGGRKALAGLLANPLKDEKLLPDRQQAVAELRDKSLWRQRFQATGLLNEEGENTVEEIFNWMEGGRTSFDKLFYKIMLVLNPLIGFSVVGLIAAGLLNYTAFLLFLLLPFGLVGMKLNAIGREHVLVSKKTVQFQKYARLFGLIEAENFESGLLAEAKGKLTGDERSAHSSIRKLSGITAAFDYRLNLLVGIFLNIFFLWDVLQLLRLERWVKSNNNRVRTWFSVLTLFD